MPAALSPLEMLVRETKVAFLLARSDGVLDASEVIQIAVDLVQKIHKLVSLSGPDKKALLLHTLKRGLDTSGGISGMKGFENASDEVKAVFEDHLINSASAAIDAVLMAASGKLDIKKPSWLCCMRTVTALAPKEQKLLKEAAVYATSIAKEEEDIVTVVVNDISANTVAAVDPSLPGATQ